MTGWAKKQIRKWRKRYRKKFWNHSLMRWARYQLYRRTLLQEPYGILLCADKIELNVRPDAPVLLKPARIISNRYLKALCRCKYIVRQGEQLPSWFRPREGQILLEMFCDIRIENVGGMEIEEKLLRKSYKRVRRACFSFWRKWREMIKQIFLFNKIVWFNFLSIFQTRGFLLDADAEKLLSYRGKHQGERCFLIGNGPSLRADDLEMLKDEITFSCNMIVKIFEQTNWRPSYHCMIDALVAKYQCEELVEKLNCTLFTNDSTKRLMKCLPEDTVCIKNVGVKPYRVRGNMMAYYIPSGATVMSFMMELAMFMGFREIYLLGVDCTSGMTSDGHFIQNYRDESMRLKDKERICKRLGRSSMTDEEVGQYYFEQSMSTYRIIQDYADVHDVHIYNATRGGVLEIFPRISLESVLRGAD